MISIVGAGAWGTALAITATRAGKDVVIWALESDVANSINKQRENHVYLPGTKLSHGIKATTNVIEIAGGPVILLTLPAQHMRKTLEPLVSRIPRDTPLVICSKGIEQKSMKLMSEVLAGSFPNNPILVLSGPTFAAEVAAGMPTAVTLAAKNIKIAEQVADQLGSEAFRPYTSDDVIGAQIGGAIKNVLAIACGIADGRELGNNARAALITRGLAEIARLCVAKGGKSETLMGLSGIGDLVLTCTSTKSRNYSLGFALGQNRLLTDIMNERNSIAEGVFTASAAAALARTLSIEMPITWAIDEILNGVKDVDRVVSTLLSRPLRAETD